MGKRKKLSRGQAQRTAKRGAKVHRLNKVYGWRGGIRL